MVGLASNAKMLGRLIHMTLKAAPVSRKRLVARCAGKVLGRYGLRHIHGSGTLGNVCEVRALLAVLEARPRPVTAGEMAVAIGLGKDIAHKSCGCGLTCLRLTKRATDR
jgi:hypothetical protein